MHPPEGDLSRRGSTGDHTSITIFGHTHTRGTRRTTTDSQKQGWDGRTKVSLSAAASVSLEHRLAGPNGIVCMAEYAAGHSDKSSHG